MTRARPPGTALVLLLLALVASVTAIYWLTFFTSGATQVRRDDVYLAFENAFPLADGWMAACALLAGLGIWRRRSWGLLFGLLTGGCLVYLSCLDVLFNLNAGNYGITSAAMGAEIVINAGSLAIGATLIAWLWRHREALQQR
jgi:hypothetical protein